MRIGVIGAGIAGLTAARTLHGHGHEVVVFDKSRGVGGRTSVRRHESFVFDHGAQYFTARDPGFRRCVESWLDADIVAEWRGRIVTIQNRALTVPDSTRRYVGVRGMNAVSKHLAEGVSVALQTRISHLARDDGGWRLTSDSGAGLGPFDGIVVALPSTQAAELLATAGTVDHRIRECRFEPCWAVLLGFDHSLNLPFDGAFVDGSSLSWISRNNSKPGRPHGESWVLHAGPEWSAEHIECKPRDAIEALVQEFDHVTGISEVMPVFSDAHLWRLRTRRHPSMRVAFGTRIGGVRFVGTGARERAWREPS